MKTEHKRIIRLVSGVYDVMLDGRRVAVLVYSANRGWGLIGSRGTREFESFREARDAALGLIK